ncbi:MAG: hypothetical protein HY039_05495 [Nitrospirae bacterium]|nr:hypothetical protein [Nitrospirota bacterium]
MVKNARDGVVGEAGEVRIIRERIGRLPDHVRLIPAESDISTFSLFGLMDFCVTVRGTIGIEAAAFGIPVLTAGTGRYDRHGFTVDSDDRQAYLDRLGRVQDVPRLSEEQRTLAERYAYGIFVARPFPLSTVTYEHKRDAKATLSCRIKAKTREDWMNAPDLNAFAEWVQSGEEDFLSLHDAKQEDGLMTAGSVGLGSPPAMEGGREWR